MTSAKQSNCILYRVIADYMPSEAYKARGCLVIKHGEILEVESPVQLEDGTEQQPKGIFVDS